MRDGADKAKESLSSSLCSLGGCPSDFEFDEARATEIFSWLAGYAVDLGDAGRAFREGHASGSARSTVPVAFSRRLLDNPCPCEEYIEQLPEIVLGSTWRPTCCNGGTALNSQGEGYLRVRWGNLAGAKQGWWQRAQGRKQSDRRAGLG